MPFVPQTAVGTSLRVLIPAISHFAISGFKPENWKKISTTIQIELSFFKKNAVLLACAE